MTEEQIALARRSVACKGWRWMDGMCFGEPIGSDVVMRRRVDAYRDAPPVGAIPFLDDPATLGCLLALVREAWGAPYAQVSPIIGNDGGGGCAGWVFYVNDVDDRKFGGCTEAEALVAALEAAP